MFLNALSSENSTAKIMARHCQRYSKKMMLWLQFRLIFLYYSFSEVTMDKQQNNGKGDTKIPKITMICLHSNMFHWCVYSNEISLSWSDTQHRYLIKRESRCISKSWAAFSWRANKVLFNRLWNKTPRRNHFNSIISIADIRNVYWDFMKNLTQFQIRKGYSLHRFERNGYQF